MRDGVMGGLGLSEADAKLAMENVIVVREDARTGLLFFLETLQPALAAHRPDLLWIDPALAYPECLQYLVTDPHLVHRVAGERNPHGVADAVG